MKNTIIQIITIIIILFLEKVFAQNNIIPNGDFERNKNHITCSKIPEGCVKAQFNSLIYNWEEALHKNDASTKEDVGNIYYFDIDSNSCQQKIMPASFCGIFRPSISTYNNITGKRFVRIRADIHKCGNNVKIKHGAIGVALENGKTFDSNKNYIIRYKIAPTRSRNCDKNKGGDVCTNSQFLCHIRFFLSEWGPQNWYKSQSDKQELINVNFIKSLTSYLDPNDNKKYVDCIFQQEERGFTPNQNNYTTLIIYAERGGAFIDDVEVFEACESPYYVQNKIYTHEVYYPFPFKESSGGLLYAGSNVTSSKPNENVIVMPLTKLIFTAEDEIGLLEGFEVYEDGEFTAVIQPCPNTFNGRISNDSIRYYDDNFSSFDDILFSQTDNGDIQIFPNPTSTHLHITMPEEDFYDLQKIELINVLGETISFPKSSILNLSNLPSGMYYLKFYFSSGIIVVKNVVKTE